MSFFSREKKERGEARSSRKKSRPSPPLSRKEERSLKSLCSCEDPLIRSRSQALLKKQRRFKKRQSAQKNLHLAVVLLQNSERIMAAARAGLAIYQAVRPRPAAASKPSSPKKK